METKEKITKLFQCAVFILDEETEEELKKIFTEKEIKYAKAIIEFVKMWGDKE